MDKTNEQLAEEGERFNHGHPVQVKAAQYAKDKSNDADAKAAYQEALEEVDLDKTWQEGYKAAQAIVEEELQAVQAQRVERPGLGSAEYALKSVLAKLGANENTGRDGVQLRRKV